MNKRNRLIIMTSITILVLLVFGGIAYAYFTALTSGDEGSSIIVQTADMRLLFTDQGNFIMKDVLPGEEFSKSFSVANVGNADATYNIRWKSIYNEFINSELILNLQCTAYDSNNTLLGSCGTIEDIVGYTTAGSIKANIPISAGITHRYTMTITFIETGENQDYNQEKSFIGALLIDTIDLNVATLRGILLDENSSILANKTIEVHSDPISTITNSKGEFLIEGIEYGNHELIIKDNNTEIARSNIVLEMTTNNSTVIDTTNISWNEFQRSLVKINIETGTNTINKIDLVWREIGSQCFGYDSTSTSITDYYCYEGNDKNLPTITNVVIPKEVNGITLTSIGNNVFENKNLTNVIIADTVNYIGSNAFTNNNLTSIAIPNSVITIDWNSFSYNQLVNITFPETLSSIGSSAFRNNQLISAMIPDSVTYIGSLAFYDNKLTSIDYPGGIEMGGGVFNSNPLKLDDPIMYYKKADGTYDKSIIIGYINDGTNKVIIPDIVKNIYSYGFYNAGLTSVTIPNGITSIERWVFNSNDLTSIIIPDTVTYIGDSAFAWNDLTSVSIPNSVKTIEANAFYKNTWSNENLSLITIDNVSGAISGSPWGAGDATIRYLRTSQ